MQKNKNKKLKEWLDEREITVKEFAKEIGLSRQAVHDQIRNDRVPTKKTLSKISKFIKKVEKKPFPAERLFFDLD